MKNSAILMLIFLFAITSRGETLLKITFNDKNKPQINYILEELPKITFDTESNIVFTSNGKASKFPHSEIKSYSFANVEWSDIENIIMASPHESAPFTFVNNIISFTSASYQRNLRIYDSTGHLLFQSEIPAHIAYNKYLDFWRPGVFIITVDNLAFKLLTK